MAGSSTLSRRLSEFVGVALFALALIWLVALVTHDPRDPVWFFSTGSQATPANFIGRVGAFLSEASYQFAGFAAFLVPLVLVVVGWHRFWCAPFDAAYTKMFGLALLFACSSALLSLGFATVSPAGREMAGGGLLGTFLASWLSEYLNRPGSVIVVVTLLILSVILATRFSFGRFFAAVGNTISNTCTSAADRWHAWRERRRKERQRRQVIDRHAKRGGADAGAPARAAADQRATAVRRDQPAAGREEEEAEDDLPLGPVRPAAPPAPPPRPRVVTPQPRAEAESGPRAPAERKRGGFTLPPVSLLDAPRSERQIDDRELMDAARLLAEKCHEFAVDGTVVQIHPGPVVTTFEFKPDAGVKYSKITGLADDLSLALRAESVLIERVPGKATVGIQIPNTTRETISLREQLESDLFRRSGSKLALALGKTIHGEPFVADLAAMPHLLIAGATGTGKSVAINSMLASVLFRSTPDDVRLILIDPKRLELGTYDEIPHLLTQVVVDPKQASRALAWAVREMEERYKTLAAEGVRNIDQYNRNVRMSLEHGETEKEGEELRPLPFIIVVIDELADLMMVASNEVEESIARLAQMARAVGIHLILATQRPSVDVITGLIKANLPARISFRVSSKVDSRTILDGNGAEQLLGRGDMLYLPPASSRLIRLHGPYVSEQECARLAAFLRKQGAPVYDQSITEEEKEGDALDFEKDDLYDEAARIVVQSGQASISYLQRRLRVGFSRAARLVDMMEADGLVSPSAGSKPREVLVDKSYFDEVDAQLR